MKYSSTTLQRYNAAVELIYKAALDGNWSAALAAIRRCSHPTAIWHLFGISRETGATIGDLISTAETATLAAFEQEYQYLNVWMQRATPLSEGALATDRQLISRDEMLRTIFYNDFVRKYTDDHVAGVANIVRKKDQRFVALNVNIPSAYEDEGVGQLLALSQAFGRHIGLAFDLSERLHLQAGAQEGEADDRIDLTIAIDSELCVLRCSPPTAHRIEQLHNLKIREGCQLALPNIIAQKRLSSLIQRIAQNGSRELLGTSVHVESTDGDFRIFLSGVGPENAEQWPSTLFAPVNLFYITFHSQAARHVKQMQVFGERHALTTAEMAVLRMLAEGKDAADISLARGTKIVTVRNQIASLLSKTGTRKQIELVSHFARHAE